MESRFGDKAVTMARTKQNHLLLMYAFLLLIKSSTSSWSASESVGEPSLDNDDYPKENIFEKPCSQLRRGIDLACVCSSGADNGTYINCDSVVFPGEFPVLPFRQRIHSYSQRYVGYQTFPSQLFTASSIPLKRLDLSHNGVVLITDKLLDGVTDTLEEITLSHNLLGDQLNPIFATNEFQKLKQLKRLELSDNDLKAIDDSLIKGCDKLQELRLDHNSLSRVPIGTLKEAKNLQRLYLEHNKIGSIASEAFLNQNLLRFLNLSHNIISNLEHTSLKGLNQLQKLDLSYNKMTQLPAGLFQSINNMQDIDLSNNFLSAVPTTFKGLSSLKRLILSANLIQNLDSGTLAELTNLEFLDLSRNNIAELPNGTLSRNTRLKILKFSVNTLRKVEDDAFKGLDLLEELYLDGNNMLAVPQSALRNLTRLRRLSLSFNRIAVVSAQLFSSNANLQHLSLSHNVIRELADGALESLNNLRKLELRGNQLTAINVNALPNSSTLQEIDFGGNRISDMDQLNQTQVQFLKLDHNNFTSLKRGQFAKMTNLLSLNVSHNNINYIQTGIFRGLNRLREVDLRSNNLATLAVGVFDSLLNLHAVYLQDNLIQQIEPKTFSQLTRLKLLQLSRNQLVRIHNNAFDNLNSLKKVILRHNKLQSVPVNVSRSTTTATTIPLRILDLGYNELTSISNHEFADLTQLEHLAIDHNQIATVGSQIFTNNSQLKTVQLSYNKLKTLPDGLLSQMSKLRVFDASHNILENVGHGVFHNCSQLQIIDLGYNRLRTLDENLFMGISRLKFNIEHNRLNSLPNTIFERSKIHALTAINLAHNFFDQVPSQPLQKQYFALEHVNLARNRIRQIQPDTNILVTIKTLDLSFNPLTVESIHNVLSEPKKVKDLNMAGTGIGNMPVLETPFLRKLNLSSNRISQLKDNVFERTHLLQALDLSANQLADNGNLARIYPKVMYLKELILSNNPLSQIAAGDLSNLPSLESLRIENLSLCTKIDSYAFSNLPSLRALNLFGLPRLESLPSRSILQQITTLEKLQIEITEPSLQDQLAPAFSPRIQEIHVHGRSTLRTIAPITLAGLTSPMVKIALHDTAITSIPASLLFPVPMSTKLILDLSGAKLSVLSPQFLAAADNHKEFLELRGLRDNPIVCDCNSRPLRRWLKAHIPVKGSQNSRRTPRQIRADESILVRVVASSSSSNNGRRQNGFDQQRNEFVALSFSKNNDHHDTINGSQSVELITENPETTTMDGQVFIVTTGYGDMQDDDSDQESSDATPTLTHEFSQVRCSGPSALLGYRLVDIAEEDLGCDGLGHGEVLVPPSDDEAISKDTIDVVVAARPSRPFTPPSHPREREPEIIWYNENEPPSNRNVDKDVRQFVQEKQIPGQTKNAPQNAAVAGLNNMDALIIGIVGGVVAFVAILIIIICLVRLKSTGTAYRGGPLASGVPMRHDKCTCLGPGGTGHHHMLCHCLPGYPGHALHAPPSLQSALSIPAAPSSRASRSNRNSIYSVPLSQKFSPPPPHPPHPPRSSLGVVSRSSFYPPASYYVTFPGESENTDHHC